jgi:hypothetical protein
MSEEGDADCALKMRNGVNPAKISPTVYFYPQTEFLRVVPPLDRRRFVFTRISTFEELKRHAFSEA